MTKSQEGKDGAKRHKHEFTGLWTHFGPYGPQDVHYHVCFDTDCLRVLVGAGRDCDGEAESHKRATLPLPESFFMPQSGASSGR